jgi:PAS domain S-box-containing protein
MSDKEYQGKLDSAGSENSSPELEELDSRIRELGRLIDSLRERETHSRQALVDIMELLDPGDTTGSEPGEEGDHPPREDKETSIETVLGDRISQLLEENRRLRLEVEEAEKEPRSGEDDLLDLFDNAPVPMAVVSDEGVFRRVNRAFESILGYDGQDAPPFRDLAGRSPEDLFGNRTEADEGEEEAGPARWDSGRAVIVCKGGEEKTFLCRASRLDAGDYLITLNEIREEDGAARADAGQEAVCRTILEDLRMGVLSCDARGNITEANSKALEMLGILGEKDLKKRNLITWPGSSDSHGISGAVAKCLESGEPYVGELIFRHGRRKGVFFRLHLFPDYGPHGETIGLQAVFQDLSDQKRAEELILQSERLRVLGQMCSGLSHTFSNVLQVVSGNANMGLTNLEVEDFEEIGANLEQIIESTRSGTEVVRLLSQFGRDPGRRSSPRRVLFDMNDAVTEGVEMCKLWSKVLLEREKISITQNLHLTPGCYTEGDPDQMAWVVLNLLRNAVEAMPEGGRIDVTTALKEDHVNLVVQDNGPGIPGGDIRKIISAFWTSKDDHVGMGLTVNSRIVRQHRGTMGVKRVKPRGTAFSIKLPKAPKPSDTVEVVQRGYADGQFNILLIDDERAVVTILGKGLRKLGNTIFTAQSGQEGLEVFEQNHIDCVVCDLGMEGMNGWEVGRELMGRCVERDVRKPPFILLTGWGGQLGGDELLSHPYVDRIVEKPVTVSTIHEIVGEEVRSSQSDLQ